MSERTGTITEIGAAYARVVVDGFEALPVIARFSPFEDPPFTVDDRVRFVVMRGSGDDFLACNVRKLT